VVWPKRVQLQRSVWPALRPTRSTANPAKTDPTWANQRGSGSCGPPSFRRAEQDQPQVARSSSESRICDKHPAEVPLPEDQHPVGELAPYRQHEAFGGAVRPRAGGRDLEHLDARVREDRVERGCELSRAIADEELEPNGALRRSPS
jgi:hypothetical protein